LQKEAEKAADELEPLNRAIAQTEEDAKKAEAALEDMKKKFKLTAVIDDVVDLAGGMANMASAAQQFINLGSIWQNEDLSTGEKLLQTVSSLAFALPMLMSGIKNTKDSLSSLFDAAGAALDYFNAKQAKATVETTKNTASEVANATAKLATAAASDKKEDELEEETKEVNKNTVSNSANTVSENGNGKGKKLDIKGKWKSTKGKLSDFGGKAKTFM
jgi:hypothetical protein